MRIYSISKFKQIVSLFSANIIGIPFGFFISIILARYLGADTYGDYMFITNILNLSVLLFSFGVFQAGNRAIVLSKNINEIREYYGAELVFLFCVFALISILLVLYTFYDPNINSKGLSITMLSILPFSWTYILIKYYEILFQADNRIKLLAITRLSTKIIFLVLISIVVYFITQINNHKLLTIFYLYITAQIIVFIYVLLKLKISFKNLKERLKSIISFNKTFGFNVYLGSIFAVGFAQLSAILISYFGIDNSGVGFYSLALTIAAPIGFIPNTIATSYYKDFSKFKQIPNNILSFTFAITLPVLILSWVLINPFIMFFFGNEYESVIYLFYILSAGIMLHGLADIYNRFLGAHGQGKILRNCSFIVGSSLLLFNIFLIPIYGEIGASYTKSFTGLIYLVSIIYYYKKYKQKLIKKSNYVQ